MPPINRIKHSLTLIARTWFQRTNGNTYHSVEVIIDGASAWTSGMHYGYGSMYEQTATEWLKNEGYLDGLEHYTSGGHEALWKYCPRKGIVFLARSIPVAVRRDLG